MKTPEIYSDLSGDFFDRRTDKPILPKKQNLSEEELAKQNICGYAALIQEIFGIYSDSEIFNPRRRLNLFRDGISKDPFETIGINQSRARDIVNAVEDTLITISSREQQAIRLCFGLDQPNGEFMKDVDIGKLMGSFDNKRKEITGTRVHQIIDSGIAHLRHPARSRRLGRRLWGDQPIPRIN